MKKVRVSRISKDLLRRAIQAGIKNWLLAVKSDMQLTAHLPGETVSADPEYYADGRMPFWTGLMSNSIEIRNLPGGGVELIIDTPYSGKIEYGGIIINTPELVEWIKDRMKVNDKEAQRIAKQLHGKELKAHPYLMPAYLRNLSAFPALFTGGFITYLEQHGR